MDIVVWLRSLGLGKYEASFRENEIDETVLLGLTAEDLKELGIAALGHRRKLLDAIGALRSDVGGKAPPADAASASAAPSVSVTPEDRAERRQVTVMFSDLVGSEAATTRAVQRQREWTQGATSHRPGPSRSHRKLPRSQRRLCVLRGSAELPRVCT